MVFLVSLLRVSLLGIPHFLAVVIIVGHNVRSKRGILFNYHETSFPSYCPQEFSIPGTRMLKNLPFWLGVASMIILLVSIAPTLTSRSALSPPRVVRIHCRPKVSKFVGDVYRPWYVHMKLGTRLVDNLHPAK
jgi:hypothetical protein